MYLVDTSAWIEWLIASPTGMLVESRLPEAGDWLVPTMVQLELAKWLGGRFSEETTDQVIAFTQACISAPLDSKTALLAADMCRRHKLTTADAVIYATARRHQATLLTCDAHFAGLPDVEHVAKVKT